MFRNRELMFGLSAVSLFCLTVLVGLYRYTGSVFPSTQQTDGTELLFIWLLWSILAGVPAFTGVLWVLRRRIRKNR